MVFGIMDLSTGKCWASKGMWYNSDVNDYNYRDISSNRVAVPKDYINDLCAFVPKEEEYIDLI